MSKKGNPGINKLADIFQKQIGQVSENPLVLDIGIINEDYSLSTNTYPNPIPKSDYLACRAITYDPSVPLTKTYCDGAHGQPHAGFGGAHVNQVELPEKMYWIRPGDKVLVAWVQNDAVVVDIIVSGSEVG